MQCVLDKKKQGPVEIASPYVHSALVVTTKVRGAFFSWLGVGVGPDGAAGPGRACRTIARLLVVCHGRVSVYCALRSGAARELWT